MDTERWLAPLTGGVALLSAAAVVALYAFGRSVPEHHEATVRTVVPGAPPDVFAVIADPSRRPEWAPRVAKIGRVDDDGGRPTWRELDPSEDRFEFSVVTDAFPTFAYVTTKPEEIGISASWTWTVAPAEGGTAIALTEAGDVKNLLFRGVWGLRDGPYRQIEADLTALSRYLGGTAPVLRDP